MQVFQSVRSPSRGSQGPWLISSRLQVNLRVSPAWTRSGFPSRNVLFALGQSIMIFRNKKCMPKGKLVISRFTLVRIQISDSVGMRSLWRGCGSHRCGSSTCPGVKLPSSLSLLILSKIKIHQLINLFLNIGDGECKSKRKKQPFQEGSRQKRL